MITTINMQLTKYEKLVHLSVNSGLTKKEVVQFVLAKIVNEAPFVETYGSALCYQSRSQNWHKFHISFSEVECEKNHDLRKIFKMSLSLLIAIGIDLYGELLLQKREAKNKECVRTYIDIYLLSPYCYSSISTNSHRILVFEWKKGAKQRE